MSAQKKLPSESEGATRSMLSSFPYPVSTLYMLINLMMFVTLASSGR